jgi:hypothetical protein
VRPPAQCVSTILVGHDDCAATAYQLGERVDDVHWCDQSEPAGVAHVCIARERALPSIPYQEVALGSGRLRPAWISRDEQLLLPAGHFRDQQLDTPCIPYEIDGRLVCDPWDPQRDLYIGNPGTPAGWLEHFSDDSCEHSLGFAYRSRCGETPPAFAREPERGLLRMRFAGAVPDVTGTFSGFSVPGGGVLGCTSAPEPPRELFTGTPVEARELAEIEEVRR